MGIDSWALARGSLPKLDGKTVSEKSEQHAIDEI